MKRYAIVLRVYMVAAMTMSLGLLVKASAPPLPVVRSAESQLSERSNCRGIAIKRTNGRARQSHACAARYPLGHRSPPAIYARTSPP